MHALYTRFMKVFAGVALGGLPLSSISALSLADPNVPLSALSPDAKAALEHAQAVASAATEAHKHVIGSGLSAVDESAVSSQARSEVREALVALLEQFVASSVLRETYKEGGVSKSGPRVEFSRSGRARVVPYTSGTRELSVSVTEAVNVALDYLSQLVDEDVNGDGFVDAIKRFSEQLNRVVAGAQVKVVTFLETAVRPPVSPRPTEPEQPTPSVSTASARNTNAAEEDDTEGAQDDDEDETDSNSKEKKASDAKQKEEDSKDPWAANAVAITLFCLDEAFEARGIDMLGPALAHFPSRDYALITLPRTSVEHPLLAHFVPATPFAHSTLNHALYLIHRDVVGASVTVDWAGDLDLPEVARLLSYTSLPPTATPPALHPSFLRNGFGPSGPSPELVDALGIPPGSRAAALLEQVQSCILDDKLQSSKFYSEKAARKATRDRVAAMPKPKRGSVAASMALKSPSGAFGASSPLISSEDADAIRAEEHLEYETVHPLRRELAAFSVRCQGILVGFAVAAAMNDPEPLLKDFAAHEFVSFKDIARGGMGANKYNSASPATSVEKGAEGSEVFCSSGPACAELLALVVNPLFRRSTDSICREVLRLYRKDVMFLRVSPNSAADDSLPLDVFVQVRPRRVPYQTPDLVTLEGVAKNSATTTTSSASTPSAPFALHVVTRKLLAMPKARVNARVVVVGASDTGLSVLESLALNPDLHCASLTLLSPYGLPRGRRDSLVQAIAQRASSSSHGTLGKDQQDKMMCTPSQLAVAPASDTGVFAELLPWTLSFSASHLDRLSLESRVLVVQDALVELDTTAQEITLSSGKVLPYDVLVLATGLQDSTARVLGVDSLAKQRAIDASIARAFFLPSTSAANSNGNEEDGNGGQSQSQQQQQQQLQGASAKSQGSSASSASGNAAEASGASGTSSSTSSSTSSPELQVTQLGPNQGLWAISSEHDAAAFASYVRKSTPRFVMIYGCTLNALTLIHGLVGLGLSPAAIVWAHEEDPEAPAWCDGDKVVAARVMSAVRDLGVQVFSFTKLVSIACGADGSLARVTLERLQHMSSGSSSPASSDQQQRALSVVNSGNKASPSFSTHDSFRDSSSIGEEGTGLFSIVCQCLVTTSCPDIDARIHKAIIDNSFIADSRLVVDQYFSTRPHVTDNGSAVTISHDGSSGEVFVSNTFAAGPIARFSRRYGRTLPLEAYDSREVGGALAQSLLKILDPALEGFFALQAERDREEDMKEDALLSKKLLAKYGSTPSAAQSQSALAETTQARQRRQASRLRSRLPILGTCPKAEAARLPGGLYYFRAQLPRLPPADGAIELKTLVSNYEGRVCRLAIDPVSAQVVGLTYVGTTAVNFEDMRQIVGLPVAYLNRLIQRFEHDQVLDIVGFLQAPWSMALYHESFNQLRESVNQALATYLASEAKDTQHYPASGKQTNALMMGALESLAATVVERRLQAEAREKSKATSPQSPSTSSGGSRDAEDVDPASGVLDMEEIAMLVPLKAKYIVQTHLLRFLNKNAEHLPGFTITPAAFQGSKPTGKAGVGSLHRPV